MNKLVYDFIYNYVLMKKLSIYLKTFISVLLTFSIYLALPKSVYAQNATLYFSPSSTTVASGQTVTVTVMVNTNGDDISGVTADFTYSSSLIEYVSTDSSNSDFSIEAEEDHVTGTVYLSRAVSGGDSFNGIGEIAQVTFRGSSNGTATLSFTDDALVTSSGDDPTDVLGTTSDGTITVGGSGSVPATGIFDKPVVIAIGIGAILLICIGSIGVIQYAKDRKYKLNNVQ